MTFTIIESQAALAQFVRRRRRALECTQVNLAIKAGVSRQWLVGVEQGKSGVPLHLLLQLLQTLDCKLGVSVDLRHLGVALADDGREDKREGEQAETGKSAHEAALGRPPEAPTRGAETYRVANLRAAGFSPDHEQFYDKSYRSQLRSMVAYIIEIEGPILDDLLVRRVVEAHSFRATRKIRVTVRRAVDLKIKRTTDGKRTVYWPESANPEKMPPFREAAIGLRNHDDIPILELAALAKRFLDKGISEDETYKQMRQVLGLSRVGVKGQKRFLKAIALADAGRASRTGSWPASSVRERHAV